MAYNSQYNVAIHICVYMQHGGREHYPSQAIADSVGTNPVVIRRLISRLKEGGIVGSIAGAGGGFYLQKPAKDINLWEIYQIMQEKDLFHQPKVNGECPVSCNMWTVVEDTFKKAELAMKPVLSKVTIAELAQNMHTCIEEWKINQSVNQ